MKIGNKLNQLRKLSGMTQEQLAEKIDAVTHWRADFYYGQRIKFCICNCVTKHNTQYSVYAIPVYRNRAICQRPC